MMNDMQGMNVNPEEVLATLPPEVQQAALSKMQDPKFMQWFQSLAPEEQQQAIERLAMDYQGQNAVADDQMMAAQMLRDTEGAEGQQIGDVYVAAHPIEHIASAMKQRQGYNQQKEAIERKKELSDMQSMGLQDVIAAELRK